MNMNPETLPRLGSAAKKFLANSRYGNTAVVFLLYMVFIIIMAARFPNFGSYMNISNILVQFAPLAIVSLAQTIVIISGGIDLSVGVTMGFTTVFIATVMRDSPFSIASTIVFVLLIGVCFGMFNGVGVAMFNIPPLIMTISSMTIIQGIAFAFLSAPGGYVPLTLTSAVTMRFGIVSMPLIIVLAIYLVYKLVLSKTRFGLHVFAIGYNPAIARTAGIKVERTTFFVYVVSSITAVLGGILLTCRIASGDPIIGTPFALDSITASIIGGASLSGGRGLAVGSIFGALIIGSLSNMMNMTGVQSFYQYVLKGLLLIITMIAYTAIEHWGSRQNAN